MKIKVCGMRDSANIQSLVSLKPDFIGFIFYPKSKRYAANVLDINILNQIPASVKKVGVFVDETLESVVEAIEKYKLDFAQLHGDESAEFCKKLKENGV
ncbi:MAG: phosphoribosylanthranilate isomerase, partial [Bacteroidota bacterium]